MRITADPRSPDYWARHFRFEPEVFFDGKLFEGEYIEADETAGTITTIKMNGAYPVYAGGQYLTETLTGTVEIRGQQ